MWLPSFNLPLPRPQLALALTLVLIPSCALSTKRPKLEMAVAKAAYLAAKNAGADESSPQLFRSSEVLFLKAKSAYKRKYFNKAKEYANLSIKYAEQAELEALAKKLSETKL